MTIPSMTPHTPRTPDMLDNTTVANLNALKLLGFAEGLQEQRGQPDMIAMTFDERLALLVDREMNTRSDRKRSRLLQRARLKVPSACIEDADFTDIRGLDRKILTALALSGWIERGDTILSGGATGSARPGSPALLDSTPAGADTALSISAYRALARNCVLCTQAACSASGLPSSHAPTS